MNTTTKAIMLCAAAAMAAGCGRGRNADEAAIEASGTNAPAARAEFTIPKSLVLRMYEAADEARSRAFPGANIGDPLEFAGLSAGKNGEAAFSAKDRPRMEMILADDCNSDEERRELWPFDIGSFEAELEKRMVRGDDGCFQRVEDDGSPLAANPTIRWANREVSEWATRELDGRYPRMSDVELRAMAGCEEIPEGTAAWRLDSLYCLVLESGGGAWNTKSYSFVMWNQNFGPQVVAVFDSFPNDREATCALCFHCDATSANNLAVLEWRHQIFRMSMDPERVKILLERAGEAEVREAEMNLDVLRLRFP